MAEKVSQNKVKEKVGAIWFIQPRVEVCFFDIYRDIYVHIKCAVCILKRTILLRLFMQSWFELLRVNYMLLNIFEIASNTVKP